MDELTSKTALVTGASAGIGAAISRELVKLGMTVIGAARRIEKLKELEKELASEKGRFVPYECDVTKTSEIYAMFAFIKSEYVGVDVCVNNAGTTSTVSIIDGNAENWKYLMDLNLISHCLCAQLTVKSLQERNINQGHLFFINSVAGQKVFPHSFTHFYSATKFALHAATDAFRQELRNLRSGIKVTEICPGLVETELMGKFPAAVLNAHGPQIDPLLPEDVAVSLAQALTTPSRVEVNQIVLTPITTPAY